MLHFADLQKLCARLYYPVFLLEKVFPHKHRKNFSRLFVVLMALAALAVSGMFLASRVGLTEYDIFMPKAGALFLLSAGMWFSIFSLESFYFSRYYLKPEETKDLYLEYDTAEAIYWSSSSDILGTFFSTAFGRRVLLRCGVTAEVFADFLSGRKAVLDNQHFTIAPEGQTLSLEDVLMTIFDQDKEFADFLFTRGIQRKDFLAVVDWEIEALEARRFSEHWWSEERLSRISGIGQSWSYGQAYVLEQYELPLPETVSRYQVHSSYGVDELKELETILARTREANALLIGDDEAGKLEILSRLSQTIEEGEGPAELSGKRVVLFDGDAFISRNPTKSEFETAFASLMAEVVYAGNIILVISNFPSFVSSTASFGTDLPSLMEPYLASSNFQLVALSDAERFHEAIEKNTVLMEHFEKVFIKDIDEANTIKVLENELIVFERAGFFFTYPALVAIAESAERYFSDGVMPDKAIDLLLEVVPKLEASGKWLVEKRDVLDLVQSKTGIPTGEVGAEEKTKLLNLERILHERIVGQDEAITAISNAVRRSRSGVANPSRPLGSFLFLGPTGVGKTETTKALAQVFFGAEAHILRLDMSEYSAYDATSKLIGSFEGKQSGILSSMLREHGYGVLLLDEFEKTTKEVMNLFLQILDEGFFSDMSGKKVNARNLIIIATSNAGSDLIWEAVKSGQDLAGKKTEIIDSIIEQGVFKPELLNRFDGVILFHPLSDANLRTIAELMLKKLKARLAERGINLTINSDLLDFLVSKGSDPKFGARPLNRAIQEEIEQIISRKIISGSVAPGATITLSEKELNHTESALEQYLKQNQ